MNTLILRQPVGTMRELVLLGVGMIALFLGLFFSAQAGLLLLAAAWIAAATWRYPWPAFLLLVAAAPFLLILKATVVLGSLTLLKDIVILTLFVRVLRVGGPDRLWISSAASLTQTNKQGRIWSARALLVPVLVLVAWAAIAFLRADSRVLGLLRLRDLLLYVPMLLVAYRFVSTKERLRTFTSSLLGSAAVVLLLGFIQWQAFPDSMVLRFDPSRSVWIPRVASVLAHPNNLGSYLLFVLPFAAALLVIRNLSYRQWLLALLVFCVGLAQTYATFSRSAWISLAVSLIAGALIISLLKVPRLAFGVLLLAAVAVASTFALPNVRSLLNSVLDPAYESNQTRLQILAGSFADISNLGAVIGEGLGDTASLLKRETAVSFYQVAAAGAREVQIAKARTFVDNGVVKTWVEQGVVGLVVAGWVAVRLFLQCLRAACRGAAPEQRALGLAVGATTIGLAVLWLFLDVPDIFPANLYFWTFAGLIAGAVGSDAKGKVQNAKEQRRRS